MMYPSSSFTLTRYHSGSRSYTKMSFPVHCGSYHIIETRSHIFHFNLNHEIIRARSKGSDWGHPHEWLKRTAGNDWVYYSTGGYAGVFEAIGEYYLPNFRYPTNNILGGTPFKLPDVTELVDGWYDMVAALLPASQDDDQHRFIKSVLRNTPSLLQAKGEKLHDIIGGVVSVLPPDARHVDYNVIPLTISRGCLYKCRFCKVKNSTPYRELPAAEIDHQLISLKELYGCDLTNYNSLFLGEHDALQADPRLLVQTVERALTGLGLTHSAIDGGNVFLFGSVFSFLGADPGLFHALDRLPGKIFINIGLESADQQTLDRLGKPISAQNVKEAFARMLNINKTYPSIEVTANFIMEDDLPESHYPSVLALIRDSLVRNCPKGTIYFSPLRFAQPSRSRLFEFNRLKVASRLPTYLYTIQRL